MFLCSDVADDSLVPPFLSVALVQNFCKLLCLRPLKRTQGQTVFLLAKTQQGEKCLDGNGIDLAKECVYQGKKTKLKLACLFYLALKKQSAYLPNAG